MTTLREMNRSFARMMTAAVFLCATMWLNQARLQADVHQCGAEEQADCGFNHYGFPYCAYAGDCVLHQGPEGPPTYQQCTCYEGNCDWIEVGSSC